jgi:hypothetical protein
MRANIWRTKCHIESEQGEKLGNLNLPRHRNPAGQNETYRLESNRQGKKLIFSRACLYLEGEIHAFTFWRMDGDGRGWGCFPTNGFI